MASMGPHIRKAAELIARDAKARAALWSVQVPPSITVRAGESTATISSGVGPSYPNEVIRVRHPVFESARRRGRTPWVTNEFRPFLAPAATAQADAAAAEVAKYIDDVAREDGFK